MPTLQVWRGTTASFDRRLREPVSGLLYGPTPDPGVSGPSPFLDTDALTADVWLGDYTPALFHPTVEWLDVSLAEFRVIFDGADTAGLQSGGYNGLVRFQRGTDAPIVLWEFRLSINQAARPPGTPPVFDDGVAVDVFAGLPCTDADVAARVAKDYAEIVDNSFSVADGTDGVIAERSWLMTSNSCAFALNGVQAGMVAVLTKGAVGTKLALRVVSAADYALTLGRFGMDDGRGSPPGKAGGSTGVTFSVPTVVGLIREEAADARRELGVAADAAVTDELKRLTVFKVIAALYLDKQSNSSGDVYKDKAAHWEAKIKALLGELASSYSENTAVASAPAAGKPADDPAWALRVPGGGDVWPDDRVTGPWRG